MVAANAVVRARVTEKVKNEAEAVLDELGLTVSDLIRMVLVRVAADRAVPFDLKVPNAATEAAMQEGRAILKRGKGKTAEKIFSELEGRIAKKGRAASQG